MDFLEIAGESKTRNNMIVLSFHVRAGLPMTDLNNTNC